MSRFEDNNGGPSGGVLCGVADGLEVTVVERFTRKCGRVATLVIGVNRPSGFDYTQAWDLLEVAEVICDDTESHLERGSSDHKSSKAMVMPWAAWAPSMRPAIRAVSMLTEWTGKSRISSSTNA